MTDRDINTLGLNDLSKLSGEDLDKQKFGETGLTLLDILPVALMSKNENIPENLIEAICKKYSDPKHSGLLKQSLDLWNSAPSPKARKGTIEMSTTLLIQTLSLVGPEITEDKIKLRSSNIQKHSMGLIMRTVGKN